MGVVGKILSGPTGGTSSVEGGSADAAGVETGNTEPVTPFPASPTRTGDASSGAAAFRNVLCGYRTFESLMNSNAEKTAEIRRLCASEFRLLQSVGLDGHSLERYI